MEVWTYDEGIIPEGAARNLKLQFGEKALKEVTNRLGPLDETTEQYERIVRALSEQKLTK